MKKLLYSTLAIAAVLAASCAQEVSKNNSEELAPVTGKHEVVYKGLASNVTKTAYADDKTFSWEAGEQIIAITGPASEESEDQYYHGTIFTGDVAGTVTNFKGEVGDGQEVLAALYPAYGRLFINNEIAGYFPPTFFVDLDDDNYFTVKSSNPLSNLPLIGVPDEANEILQFHTAAGAAKFTFKGLTPGKKLIRLFAEDEKLSGYFAFDNGLYTNNSALSGTYSVESTYEKDGVTRDTTYNYNCSNKYVQYIVDANAEGTATFYAPLPVGKIGAGSTVYIYDYNMETDNATLVYSRVLSSDLTIKENAVATVAPLTVAASEWESIGTGKFIDNYFWTMFGFTEGEYVDVAIMRDKNNKNLYRMENPFAVAKAKFGFTNKGEATADEYFEFTALPSNGKVLYDEVQTGLYLEATGEATVYASPSLFSNADASRNIVVKFQEDGVTPSSIQFDPVYYWDNAGYWSWFTAGEDGGGIIGTKEGNNIAQLLFPGQTGTYDLDLSVKYTGDSVVDEKGASVTATVLLGANLTGAQLVIAQDAASAKAAIEAGAGVTTITESDSDIAVTLPEDAVTGKYYVYAYSSVTEGLTEACRQLLASETGLEYFNPDDPDKYSLDDIIGTWETNAARIYVSSGSTGSWRNNQSVDITLAASNDEDAGNIMITGFHGDTFDTPLYGSFDTQKGLFQAAGGQIVIDNYNGQTGANQRGMALCDYEDIAADLLFYLEENGTLTYGHGKGYLYPVPTKDGEVQDNLWFGLVYSNLVFNKSTASGAPLKAMGNSSSKTNYVEVSEAENIPAHIASERISCKQKTQEPMFYHLGHEGRKIEGIRTFGFRK